MRNTEFKFQLRLDAPKSWHDLSGDQQAAVSVKAREIAEAAGFEAHKLWAPDLEENHLTRRVVEMVWNLRQS